MFVQIMQNSSFHFYLQYIFKEGSIFLFFQVKIEKGAHDQNADIQEQLLESGNEWWIKSSNPLPSAKLWKFISHHF